MSSVSSRGRGAVRGYRSGPRRPEESNKGASLTTLRVCTARAGETTYLEIPCERAGHETVNHGLITRELGVAYASWREACREAAAGEATAAATSTR